jgi:precorrin-3B C17-methyltransferase / cobalt-factor III methyltransferase
MEKCNGGGGREENTAQGMIYVVGTGPGDYENLTPAAVKSIHGSDVVIGYRTYLDLIADLLHGKEVISSSMMQEVERCAKAFEFAMSGRRVVMISGGDPGIYAMAGLIYEMAVNNNSTVPIKVIPGLAAVNSCAARLGAPLMHDFATISLSDLLTPWEVIEKRLHAAASADFVIALYNPKSKKRTGHIGRACDIIMQYRKAETPVGIVSNAMRENETITLTDLGKMPEADISMQSTVIIGNSTTFTWQGRMITPRGYKDKYKLQS